MNSDDIIVKLCYNQAKDVTAMKILLADDEKSLVRALSTILSRNNYTVDCAYNGEEALSFLENGEYDAAILDIMMPKLDGVEVLKKIRAKGNSVPVILLTAKSEVEDKVNGLDSGADDYLTKPFDTRELLARLRAITRKQTEHNTARLTFGNISLDRATYEMTSPYGIYRLANKEYQMLELLMNNPNCVISGEKFIEKIWGYENDTEQNIVWVNISYLRKKLTSLNANIRIKAVRNAGYVLEEIL